MVALADNPAERTRIKTRRRKSVQSGKSVDGRVAFGGDQIPDGRQDTRATIPICGSMPHRDFALLGATGCLRRNAPPVGTQPLVNNLYHGMTLDAVTGLYYSRFRNYSPSLGRWVSQDPAGYINGANTYQFVKSGPVGAVDPSGASSWAFHIGTGWEKSSITYLLRVWGWNTTNWITASQTQQAVPKPLTTLAVTFGVPNLQPAKAVAGWFVGLSDCTQVRYKVQVAVVRVWSGKTNSTFWLPDWDEIQFVANHETRPFLQIAAVLRRYKYSILGFHFTSFLGPVPGKMPPPDLLKPTPADTMLPSVGSGTIYEKLW